MNTYKYKQFEIVEEDQLRTGIYPSDDELEYFETADLGEDFFQKLCSVWSSYGQIAIDKEKDELHLVTGGWSGNEEIIMFLRKNIRMNIAWLSDHRGGLHIYRYSYVRKNERHS